MKYEEMLGWSMFMISTASGFILESYSQWQCLDGRAPFQPSESLSFCSEYGSVGCCSSENDGQLQDRLNYVQGQASSAEWSRCQSIVKEILCQRCSPYAGGIFDGSRSFPGLCSSYCHDFFDMCRNLLWLLDPGLAKATFLDNRDRFCARVAPKNSSMCYPDVISLPTNSEPANQHCVCFEPTNRWLSMPVWAGHAEDGSGRLFVAEQRGKVSIYDTRTKTWKLRLFLDMRSQVFISPEKGDEKGLLSLAFHPDHANNRRIFLFYALERGQSEPLPEEYQSRSFTYTFKVRVSEMLVRDDNRDAVDVSTEKILLEVLQPFQWHNGGALFFGADGYLYISFGDGGGGGDPFMGAQDNSLLHGTVIRIDVDSNTSVPYTIPADNPFVGQDGIRPEIFSYGLRNPWRCGMDRGDKKTGAGRGRILCGDVGQEKYEEMDVLVSGGNFGWPAREGNTCYNNQCGQIGPEVYPAYVYNHTLGKSVTGGVFYRGCENKGLNGTHVFGDYRSRVLLTMHENDDGNWTSGELPLCLDRCPNGLEKYVHGGIMSFGEDEQGELYILTDRLELNFLPDGRVHRIVDPTERNDPSRCEIDWTKDERVNLPPTGFAYEVGYRTYTILGLGSASYSGR
ncbi:hypothetical protein RRG08_065992 [Elysia crispata]|uniref:HHIP-like protein 2 n=1 Tax=Elysia crispata TaxID=231223 RepID=A0AAE1DSC4_9GAST|nr:hypothetical protein RRG08_065992 [Elysia crispata]